MEAGGAVRYRIVADGKPVFERRSAGAVDIDLDVRGVRRLELVTEGTGSNPDTPAQIAWAGPELIR
jgi:hypothetical protein